MKKDFEDTWEIAEYLEQMAKSLKNAPKMTLKRQKIIPEQTIKVEKDEVEQKKRVDINYSEKTVKQLKAICKNRKIKGYSSLKKDNLIKLLIEKDEGITTIDKIRTAFEKK